MITRHQIAKQLGGHVSGLDILMAGPGHSPTDRSLAVRFSDAGFTVHSFAGDNFGECRDHVAALLGNQPIKLAPSTKAIPTKINNKALALSIWADSKPWQGSLVETYLAGRGVSLPRHCEDIRFHPSCPMLGEKVACMVALVRNVETLEPVAIHRTHLALNCTKGALGRLGLGPTSDGVVMLSPDYEVERVLGIGEGIETTLSLRLCPDYGDGPVWAMLNAGNMAKFKPMAGVQSLFIAVDHDPAGQNAAHSCAQNAHDQGAEVTLIEPLTFKSDLNNLIMKGVSQ